MALKPFKVGDYVSTWTVDGEGTVETIGLVYTSLVTTDNRVLVIPNNTLANSPLTNLTGMEKRRLIINVLIDYESDLERAKELLTKLLRENPWILKEEDILAVVDSLGERGVSLSARGWTRTEDYWQAGGIRWKRSSWFLIRKEYGSRILKGMFRFFWIRSRQGGSP